MSGAVTNGFPWPPDTWETSCLSGPESGNILYMQRTRSSNREVVVPLWDCPALLTQSATCACSRNATPAVAKGSSLRSLQLSDIASSNMKRIIARGTGDHVFITPSFVDWRYGKMSNILRINGVPGSGKSFLAAAILAHLEDNPKPSEIVCSLFCDGRFKDSHPVVDILWVLLRRCRQYCQGEHELSRLLVREKQLERWEDHLSSLTLKYVVETMQHILERKSDLVLVLDGLPDVQMSPTRRLLLDELVELIRVRDAVYGIKLLILTEPGFVKGADTDAVLEMSPKSAWQDLGCHVRQLISQDATRRKYYNEIKNAVRKAENPFMCFKLLLRLVPWTQSIATTKHRLNEILDSRSKTSQLTIYNAMFGSILDEDKEIVNFMLTWVAHAARPLYIWELNEAIRTKFGILVQEADVEKKTGEILAISSTQTVNFVHLDASGYLMSTDRVQEKNDLIARICLEAFDFESLQGCSRTGRSPMFYAIANGHVTTASMILSRINSFGEKMVVERGLALIREISDACPSCTAHCIKLWIQKVSRDPDRPESRPIRIAGEHYYDSFGQVTGENQAGFHRRAMSLKWFPGDDMYGALEMAAEFGFDVVCGFLVLAENKSRDLRSMLSMLRSR